MECWTGLADSTPQSTLLQLEVDRTELIGVRMCWTELRVRREGEGGGRREAEGGVREGGVRSVGLGCA